MGKKTDDADVKKECPSCGLGVALDAKICEFCGWDFDEEDEWILQIERLERDLVMEKQNFEPGTVGSRIEASLHTPESVKREQMKTSAAKAKLQQQMEEVLGTPEAGSTPAKAPALAKPSIVMREARREEVRPVAVKEEPEVPEPVAQEPTPMATASSSKVRRVRKVKGPQASQPMAPRVVRKAKE
jgi:rubredoxin